MKILIYGLGQGLDLVEKRIRGEHKIIGYTDSYSDITVFRGNPFYKLEKLQSVFFDFVVIVIKDKKVAWEVRNLLIDKYGLSENQVVPFFVYANYELHNWKLQNYNLMEIRGLIFGNSHAKCGFLEQELEIPMINFSVSAQDIYYNYKIFEKCISDWGDKFKKLQYIIIDLYDYCYFNYDISMCLHAVGYILGGGYLEEHNFKNNPNYSKSFMDELLARFYIPDKTHIMQVLFDSISLNFEELYKEDRYHHIEKNAMLTQGPILGSAIAKRNELTIEENIKIMKLFLHDIYTYNPNIQIIFTLIPRYAAMEYAIRPFIKKWESEFNDIVLQFCNKYNIYFLNYKDKNEISENPNFYYDVEHLNTVGGRVLSSILNEDLRKLKI